MFLFLSNLAGVEFVAVLLLAGHHDSGGEWFYLGREGKADRYVGEGLDGGMRGLYVGS